MMVSKIFLSLLLSNREWQKSSPMSVENFDPGSMGILLLMLTLPLLYKVLYSRYKRWYCFSKEVESRRHNCDHNRQ